MRLRLVLATSLLALACGSETDTSNTGGSNSGGSGSGGANNGSSGSLTGDASRGQALFATNCAGCHPNGAGASAKAKADADGARAVIRSGKSPMPAFGTDKLSDQAVADIIAYLKTL